MSVNNIHIHPNGSSPIYSNGREDDKENNLPHSSMIRRIQQVFQVETEHLCAMDEPSECSPLTRAIIQQNGKSFKALLKRGVNLNENGAEPLFEAIYHDRFSMLRQLLAHGADDTVANSKDNTPIAYAESLGKKEAIRIMLQHLFSKGLSFADAIEPAIIHGYLNTVQVLLEFQNKEQIEFPRLLQTAQAYRQHSIFNLLLQTSPPLNETEQEELLLRGMLIPNFSCLTLLLTNKKNLSIAFDIALSREDLPAFSFLVKKAKELKVDLNRIRNKAGDTLLHSAAEKKNIPIFILLQKGGIDMKLPNHKGITPWDIVIQHGVPFIEQLIEEGLPVPTHYVKSTLNIEADVPSPFYANKGDPFETFFAKEAKLVECANQEDIVPLLSILSEQEKLSDYSLGRAFIASVQNERWLHARHILKSGSIWPPLFEQAIQIMQNQGNQDWILRLQEQAAIQKKIEAVFKEGSIADQEQKETAILLQDLLLSCQTERNFFCEFAAMKAVEAQNWHAFWFLIEILPQYLQDSPCIYPRYIFEAAWRKAVACGEMLILEKLRTNMPDILNTECSEECWESYMHGHKEHLKSLLKDNISLLPEFRNRFIVQTAKDQDFKLFSLLLRSKQPIDGHSAGQALLHWVEKGHFLGVAKLLRSESSIPDNYIEVARKIAQCPKDRSIYQELEQYASTLKNGNP